MGKREQMRTIIGENSFFQGKFIIPGELVVDGKFEGNHLQIEHLIVNKKGKIKSGIKTNTAIIGGIIIGNITAKTSITLLSSAKVLGSIKTPELIIQNGVVLDGRVTILNELKKSPQSIINKLYDEKT
jgi:cytoskeletal protein CcmA (bactofilin family)